MPSSIALALLPTMVFAVIGIIFALIISDFQSAGNNRNYNQNTEILQEIKNLNITMTNIHDTLNDMKNNGNKEESEKKNDQSEEENLKD